MQTSDIVNVVKKFPAVEKCFLGCVAIDRIPGTMAERSCLIFNLDQAHLQGSHWVTLIHNSDNNYEVFDSLGTKFPVIQPYLKFPSAQYEYNTNAFQLSKSSTCGFYAIYFLVNRMMNIDMSYRDLLSDIFEINKSANEKLVLEFFNEFV